MNIARLELDSRGSPSAGKIFNETFFNDVVVDCQVVCARLNEELATRTRSVAGVKNSKPMIMDKSISRDSAGGVRGGGS